MSSCVAFGPSESFLFNSPGQWTYGNLPSDINDLLHPQVRIKEIYDLALGPLDGSYVITYVDLNDNIMVLRDKIPIALEAWLKPKPNKPFARDASTLRITLGPEESWFAFDKDGASWAHLPESLTTAVASKRDKKGRFIAGEFPAFVSLGANGMYVFVSQSGSGCWDLCGQNDGLNNFLNGAKSLKEMRFYLDPYRPGTSFGVLPNGNCPSRIPKGQGEQQRAFAADWKIVCQQRMQARAAQARAMQQRQMQRPQPPTAVKVMNNVNLGLSLANNVMRLCR